MEQFVNQGKKIENSNNNNSYSKNSNNSFSKNSDYTSKNSGSNFSQQIDNENLYKDNKSPNSRISELEFLLKTKVKENENLLNKLKTSEDNKLKLESSNNKYKKLIQDNEIIHLRIVNDYKQKEERYTKNIANLKNEINETKSLLKTKEGEVMNYISTISRKDNIIKLNQSKINSLEEEKKKYLKDIERYEKDIKELSEVQIQFDNLKNEQDRIINNSKFELEEKKVLENNI